MEFRESYKDRAPITPTYGTIVGEEKEKSAKKLSITPLSSCLGYIAWNEKPEILEAGHLKYPSEKAIRNVIDQTDKEKKFYSQGSLPLRVQKSWLK